VASTSYEAGAGLNVPAGQETHIGVVPEYNPYDPPGHVLQYGLYCDAPTL
jgi:hypothetical protein